MGRNRKPVAFKFAEDSYRADRDGTPLATRAGAPIKPAWLGPVASEVWDRTVDELLETDGLLCPVDGDMLALYCHSWQRLHEARELIAREGVVIVGKGDIPRRHPACMIENKALQEILSIGRRFGLDPVARAGLSIDPATQSSGVRRRQHYRSDDDELAELIR